MQRSPIQDVVDIFTRTIIYQTVTYNKKGLMLRVGMTRKKVSQFLALLPEVLYKHINILFKFVLSESYPKIYIYASNNMANRFNKLLCIIFNDISIHCWLCLEKSVIFFYLPYIYLLHDKMILE